MIGLTDKQQRVLNWIQEFIGNEGYPPTLREIGKGVGLRSLRGVTVHLDALQRKGFLIRYATPRAMKVFGSYQIERTPEDALAAAPKVEPAKAVVIAPIPEPEVIQALYGVNVRTSHLNGVHTLYVVAPDGGKAVVSSGTDVVKVITDGQRVILDCVADLRAAMTAPDIARSAFTGR